MKRILVTGGAGFVGSTLSLFLKRDRQHTDVIAFDNLHRRGSELNLPKLKDAGVVFIHGDVRNPEDLSQVGKIDLLLECSAEPSVMAGYDGGAAYLINTNLAGTVNCLDLARRHEAAFVFLSTSRVYPIEPLRNLPLVRAGNRLEIQSGARGPGWSQEGITADFPLNGGIRSLYGASKLCSELLIAEYGSTYHIRTVVNRCGVISGPWQMGKVDQGFVVHWCARHFYGGNLAYKGFGGQGLQVRDVLHVEDLYALLKCQMENLERHNGHVYNVGGGRERSFSLQELSHICRLISGKRIEVGSIPETHSSDIPYYVTDNEAVRAATGWTPSVSIEDMVEGIFEWLAANRLELEGVFA